ncbi:MAG TPA: hypothetical protein VLA96_00155 [Terriglobales bacterium]|nr:hypothetical protein [Terriglobales bacterium]
MYARTVVIRLKTNALAGFNQALEKEIIPLLRRQAGFRDELAVASDDRSHVTAISLWDTQAHAEAYNSAGYPAVLMSVEKYLDGVPKVRFGSVINSTPHKLVAVIAAA